MRGEPVNQLPSLLTLAHELKSPLALIRQLSLTRDYYDDTEARLALKRIELTAQRSLRLVETLTRSYGAKDFPIEPIQLKRLCEEIVHELAPFASEKQQELQLQLPKASLLAVGNREIVSSVVFGLCDNALSYDRSSQPIVLRALRVKDSIRVGVNDHSSTMDATASSKFGRQPINLTRQAGGSGLGLYIASQFAQAMEGKIGFLRRRAGGHMFYLDLPRSSQLSLV